MATKKDLVEAYAFSRRRLVTAFLSGAPGGREVEPARPGRTIVGGLALAILLVAGAAIASVLASRTTEDWNKEGLVVSKQQAADYVILKSEKHPTLIPVINVTSAQLIFGADLTPTFVDQSVIADQTPGAPIGILGAPNTVPAPDQFIDQGWTSCTDADLGMSLDISETDHVSPEPGKGALVSTRDAANGRTSYYLIAESSDRDYGKQRAYAYPVPDVDAIDTTLSELGLDDRVQAVRVPEAWVRLFPPGGPLTKDSFALPGYGGPARLDQLPAGTTVGSYWVVGDEGKVVTQDGLATLDPFSLAVYENTAFRHGNPPPQLDGTPPPVAGAGLIDADAHWPAGVLDPLRGQLCGQLDVRHGAAPLVQLTGDPTSTAAVSSSSTTDSPLQFAIDRGHGAFVEVGDWDSTTSTRRVVIDARGYSYALNGDDTLEKLGYDDGTAPLVPDTWEKLFTAGVPLSTAAALCPPTTATSGTVPDCNEPPG